MAGGGVGCTPVRRTHSSCACALAEVWTWPGALGPFEGRTLGDSSSIRLYL
jgi:hypothetical protein